MLSRTWQLHKGKVNRAFLVLGLSLVVFSIFILPAVGTAAPPPPAAIQTDTFGLQGIDTATGLAGTDIRITIARIIRAIFAFLGTIALVLVLYGGYMIMTSGGSEDKVSQGKRILVNASIGLAIILSAFAITQFVISRLSSATDAGFGRGTAGLGSGVSRNSFAGSGALGGIIDDHYPTRGQRDVARNTKIVVTFNEPIDPSSVVTDTNANGTLGDCINLGTPDFRWDVHCDRASTSSIRVTRSDSPTTTVELAAIATYGQNQEVLTYVLRPLTLLGDSTGDVTYDVQLTSDIRKGIVGQVVQAISAFFGLIDQRYEWSFETSAFLDVDPPTVVSAYPAQQTRVAKNTILQLTFSEPVDPSLVQGRSSETSAFTNVIFGNRNITGEWKLTNGYRTIEFVSDLACGQNSCGDTRFCIPVTCAQGAQSCTNPVDVLLRTANLIGQGSFEAIPGSGIMDLAGNALDGDADSVTDGRPTSTDLRAIRLSPTGTPPYENEADNYYWSFLVSNDIDDAVPHIEQVFPGIDEQGLAADAPMTILFSRPMWFQTFGGIEIEEWGLTTPTGTRPVDPIWFTRSATTGLKTTVTLAHREFGPNGQDAYYFASVSSTVRGLNQNCIYPGRGPVGPANSSPVCDYQVDRNGTVTTNVNCTDVNISAATDTSCVQTNNPNQLRQSDLAACRTYMESISN